MFFLSKVNSIIMVLEIKKKGKKYFICSSCGFVYSNKKYAEECQDFCTSRSSCNMELQKKAVATNVEKLK